MDVQLASEIDLVGFSDAARALLGQQVPPEAVRWHVVGIPRADQFADPAKPPGHRAHGLPRAASAIVPASFLRLCEIVVLHHDAERFALLYRLLWRLVYEPGLRNDAADPDMLRAHQMGQSVRREMHKMKAFLRFHAVHLGQDHRLQLAWFDPAHHIVEAVAPWFVRRSPQARWAILTPERSVEWDTLQLHFAAGLPRTLAPAPAADESTWLDRYHTVFDDGHETMTLSRGVPTP